MRKVGLLAVVVAIALSITVVVVVKSSSDGPEDVMQKFVSAYNSLDFDKMLECLDPEIVRPIQSMMGVAQTLLGVDVNDILGMMPLVADMTGTGGTQPKMSCEIHETVVNGNEATMRLTITVTADGETTSETNDVNFIKIDGEWYITEQ